MSNFEVFTTATPERAQTIVAEIAPSCGWNTYPPGSYYPHRSIKLLLILSLGREDASRMLFVGYNDMSERGGIEVSVYPHPSTNLETLGVPYECLVGRLRQRLAPQLSSTSVQPGPPKVTSTLVTLPNIQPSSEPEMQKGQIKLQLPVWHNEMWYQRLSIEDRERYNWLRPHKEAWESGKITEEQLAEYLGKSSDTTRGWRRELRRKGVPDMDWKKL